MQSQGMLRDGTLEAVRLSNVKGDAILKSASKVAKSQLRCTQQCSGLALLRQVFKERECLYN